MMIFINEIMVLEIYGMMIDEICKKNLKRFEIIMKLLKKNKKHKHKKGGVLFVNLEKNSVA